MNLNLKKKDVTNNVICLRYMLSNFTNQEIRTNTVKGHWLDTRLGKVE